MTAFLLTAAVLSLVFALYLVRDQRSPVTLINPGQRLQCDYCGASDAGVHFNGTYLDYLCDRCHREAEDAQVRA